MNEREPKFLVVENRKLCIGDREGPCEGRGGVELE